MARGGYAWWYLDAVSDDGEHALSVIAFVGSVFSPFYASARRRAGNDVSPMNHCALNVALYRKRGGGMWALTEHAAEQVQRTASALQIGSSALLWGRDMLALQLDERTAPQRTPLRGMLRVHPSAVTSHSYALDAAGRHHWRPIAPCARIEVALARPALRWQGEAYLDSNIGSAPLEDDFVRWDWMRAPLQGGRTAVLYDGTRRDGTPFGIAQAFAPDGTASAIEAPPRAPLPATRWRLAREARCEAGSTPQVQQSLEDGPFYARGLLATQLQGRRVLAVHESLSLDRFRARWVQALLPFRMRGLRRAALQRLGLGATGRQP